MGKQAVHILLVEDEEAHAELVRRAFDSCAGQFHLTMAGNLEEARACLAESEPNLVIADLLLPDGRGTELLPAEGEVRRFPLVVMTSHGDEQVAVEAMKAGALDYVVKSEATLASMPRIAERALREWGHITERQRAEEALKEYSERLEEMVQQRTQELGDAQEELIRQERLAMLGQLAGGVAHELRNPLGAIRNAAYFLNLTLEEPSLEVKEMLEILDREVVKSDTIIRSLLDMARAKPPTRREVDVNDVVRAALFNTAVPENVEVVSELDASLPTILADHIQLDQAFGNIILNAIQAMPEGGQLAIKSAVFDAERVAISFTDTGVGISEESLERVFEPLFTTKSRGIGLGLALVKMLVEGHGGTVEVESEVGKGSTFTLILPTEEVRA